jgi:hypothetical protein
MTSENGDEELIEPVPIGIRGNGELERHGCRAGITPFPVTRLVSAAAPFPAGAPATAVTATPA